jgi:hypothetical protein
MRHNKGQSLTEYSLVIALVALASIAGIAILASNTQTQLAKESGTTRAPIVVDNQLVDANLAAPTLTVNGGAESGVANPNNQSNGKLFLPPDIPGTLSACVQGLCANFPLVNQSNDRVDVAAGNGGDRILQFSRTLMQMAQSVEENMKDPGLAGQIRQLANTGHSLGDLQKNVMVNSAMSTGISKSTPLRILKGNGSSLFDGYKANANNFNAQFNILTQAMNARGGKIPDSVKNLISQNALQIQRITGGLTVNGSFSSAINTATVQLTHQSANGICAGQSSDTCIRR